MKKISGVKRLKGSGPTNHPIQPGSDLIALGTKPKDGRISGADVSNKNKLPPTKKPKMSTSLHHGNAMNRFSSLESPTSRMSPTIPDSNAPCIDCPPDDLVDRVTKHFESNKDQVEGLLCGAIRNLRLNRVKPDLTLVLSILWLAKIHPEIFITEYVIESLCSLLKRDVGVDYVKSKTNNIIAIMACTILHKVLKDDSNWPTMIVQVFLDDSFADRIWVDHVECQSFVMNVLTAFETKTSKKPENDDLESNLDFIDNMPVPRFNSKLTSVQQMALDLIKDRMSRRDLAVSVGQNQAATAITMQGKYLIQTLTSACGIQEVRTIAIQKLEIWFQNPKLAKSAQDLLHAICVNCITHTQEDVNVIGGLTKLRLKSKLHLNLYLASIKELIEGHSENLKTLLTCVLYNELSNSRNQSNMAVISFTLQTYPDAAAKALAAVCQDLLLQQEDYSRHVRGLLREIVRSVKHEIQFTSLARGLMSEADMEKYLQLSQAHKQRYVSAVGDLVCLITLLSLSPQAKEAVNIVNGKKKASDSLSGNPDASYLLFKNTVADIQHDALHWVHVIVMPRLAPSMSATPLTSNFYLQLMYKLLFLRQSESYLTRDNWPPEAERVFMIKACHDAPVREETLLRISAMGLSQDNPVSAGESLELINQLVRRAALLARPDLNPITAIHPDFIDNILRLSQYHHPPNIKLPSDYVPPSLAITQLYWTAMQSLLIIISLNPTTVARQAWEQYPMLKVLMEMVLVNRFSYPPVTLVDENGRNQMVGKERQLSSLEKSEILEFESHLAAATTRLVVNEDSSLLLAQLMAMDPRGHPRRPPDRFLEQLSTLSPRLQLGIWLCRSREPDFLLEIINRHGENQSMKWLPDLVVSAKSDVGLLPVQCLCEFLIIHETEAEKLSSGGIHVNELVTQLRKILFAESLDEPVQVIQYFLRKLCSPQSSMRKKSRKALSLVLSSDEMEVDEKVAQNSFKWLLVDLLQLPHYTTVVRPQVVESLQHAVMIESDPVCVAAYVKFLANDLRQFESLTTPEEAVAMSSHYARVTSHLLIDRRVLVESAMSLTADVLLESHQLSAAEYFVLSMLDIFVVHLRLARESEMRRRMEAPENERDAMPWSNSQDEFYVKWPGEFGAATLHILVPQASIILLGYGPPSFIGRKHGNSPIIYEQDKSYHELMNLWFNEGGYIIPQAFLMDIQEEAILIPDWLRLKMLRSEVMPATRRLAFAAVRDLEVNQIVLFVQSFGIPVESMNLLLEILDSQCDSNSDVILAATSGNATYMARLLQVQKMRGCKAGSKVAELLKASADEPMEQVHSPPDCASDTPMETEVISPQEKKFCQNISQTRSMLIQLFSKQGSHESINWSNMLRVINQSNSSKHACLICIESLHSLIFMDSNIDFVSFLYNCSSRACCLLRALDCAIKPLKTSHPKIYDMHKEIIDKIYESGKVIMEKLGLNSSSLYSFSSLWRSRNSSSKGPRPRRLSSASEQSENLRHSDWSKLEEFLKHQLAFLDKDNEIRTKVDLVAQILLKEISHRRTQMSLEKIHYNNVCFTSIGTTGLLVDWLQLLDPELLARTPTLQRQLLFASGRNDFSDFTTPVFDQAYLLSLLAEHCNWENLHSCFDWLLSDTTPDPTQQNNSSQNAITVDPKTALDFVWVVVQAPKIWKGRENKSSSLNEAVLQLNTAQFSRLLSYVVAATANQSVSTAKLHSNHDVSYVDLFNFYFRKFGQTERRKSDICEIVKFLKSKIDSSSEYSPYKNTWWKLLAQMYVIQPNLSVWDSLLARDENDQGFIQSDIDKFSDIVSKIDVGCDCQTDALVCSLLNRLGYVRCKSTIETRIITSVMLASHDSACDANLTLAKMARSRPLLILRQLPLLSSMLRGRTRHDFFEFKVQHHLPLMSNAIGILRQLSPFLYREMHSSYLYTIMVAFWQMLRNYCHRARRQMLPVLLKTLSLTHDYLRNSPSKAASLLSDHMITFQMLLKTYWDHENVTTSVSNLQSSVFCCSTSADHSVTNSARPSVLPMPAASSKEKPLPIYLELMAENQDLENITQVLADFDESSKRRIDNVAPYLTRLCRIFATSRDSIARVSAFSAALLHAQSYPECAGSVIFPEYIDCLKQVARVKRGSSKSSRKLLSADFPISDSPSDALSLSLLSDRASVARDLLQFLPDMSILCRENAVELLGVAFDTGLKCGAACSYPKSITSESASNRSTEGCDATSLIARSLWLLCGLDESDLKQ